MDMDRVKWLKTRSFLLVVVIRCVVSHSRRTVIVCTYG